MPHVLSLLVAHHLVGRAGCEPAATAPELSVPATAAVRARAEHKLSPTGPSESVMRAKANNNEIHIVAWNIESGGYILELRTAGSGL